MIVTRPMRVNSRWRRSLLILSLTLMPLAAGSENLFELGRSGYERTLAQAKRLGLQTEITPELVLRWCTNDSTCALTTLYELRKINPEREAALANLECWIKRTYDWSDRCQRP